MAKKKNHKPAAAVEQMENKPVTRKPTRKEQRAMEEQRSRELKEKRRKIARIALLLSGAAVVISFASNAYSGQSIYEWIQIGCFVLLGIAGGVFMYGARYEETEKNRRTKRNLGLLFIVVALSVVMIELIQMMLAT